MSVYRIKESHPTAKKIKELERKAEDLGLTLSARFDGQILINDKDQPDITFQYRDQEQSFSDHDTTPQFPYCFETKIIFEKGE